VSILIALVLAANLIQTVLIFCAILAVKRLYQNGKAFITPASEGKPSPLALVTQVAADMLGRGVTAQLKATFMGKAQVDRKNQQGIDADLAVDSLSAANPLIGAVLQSFPTLTKRLVRNPALLDMALSRLTGAGKPPADAPGNNGNQIRFNL
jgi:hypothetical protein